MFRTILALLLTLLITIVIGAFQIVGLDIAGIAAILNQDVGSITGDLMTYGAALFGSLMTPYSAAIASPPAYAPLVALGVAGFVAGLVSKSGVRMFFVSIIALVLFFLGYFVLYQAGSISDLTGMYNIARNMLIDLGVAFGLLFIPGVIGASLTADEY
jgi:hypothetical protein